MILWFSLKVLGFIIFAAAKLIPVVNIITTNKPTIIFPSHCYDVSADVCTMREQHVGKSEHPLPYVSLFNRDTYSVKRKIHTDIFLFKCSYTDY